MGARFGGLVIDSLVVGAVSIVLILIFGLTHRTHDITCNTNGRCLETTRYTLSAGGYFVSLLVGMAYSALLIGTQGRSLGHRATGIRVVDPMTDRPIGPLRAGWRWLVMIVTGLVFTLGYWSPFFDDYRRRGWHDKASKSIVYSVR
jgi:uncharacterized RDD family membrane protein YckC